MSIRIYKGKKTKERIEASKSFAGTTPMTCELNDDMESITLRQLARRILAKYPATNVVGITLVDVTFAPILDPESFERY